jgi:hypothetical protein
MDTAIVIILCVVGIAGLLWSASVYERATKRYKAQLEITDELQQRSNKLLEREEAVLARAEALLDRLETKLPA